MVNHKGTLMLSKLVNQCRKALRGESKIYLKDKRRREKRDDTLEYRHKISQKIKDKFGTHWKEKISDTNGVSVEKEVEEFFKV
jgi:hypothetical protein